MSAEFLTTEEIKVRDRNLRQDVIELLPPGVMTILHDHGFTVCPEKDYRPWDRQYKEADENRRAAEKVLKAEMAASCIPYKGVIVYCQVSSDRGRAGSSQCAGKARFVRRFAHDPKGDGRIAVCPTHRRSLFVGRYITLSWQRSMYGPGAVEPVESEYQP